MTQCYLVDDFFIDFRCNSYQNLSSLDSVKYTISEICNKYPPPYYLMVSGGVDSQAMLWSWKNWGCDYIPTTVIYNDWLNREDLETLWQFSERENIQVQTLNFDVLDFYFSDNYRRIVDEFQCASPQISTYIAMTQNLSGTVIFSGYIPRTKRVTFDHIQRSLIRYSLTRSLIPFFFWHTPELIYNSIKNVRYSNQTADLEVKAEVYNLLGYPVISQQKENNLLTGFGGVKQYFDNHYSHLVEAKHKLYNKKLNGVRSNRTHDLLLRYPHMSRIGAPEYEQYWNI